MNKGVCHKGHLLSERARTFECPQCRRNKTRKEARARLPRELSEKLMNRNYIWLADAYPVNKARIIARAYLALLKRGARQ